MPPGALLKAIYLATIHPFCFFQINIQTYGFVITLFGADGITIYPPPAAPASLPISGLSSVNSKP